MNERRLAVAACALGVLAMICGSAIDIVTWSQGTLTSSTGGDLVILPIGLLMGFLGVLITIRRPGNRIGWLYCAFAFLAGLVVLADAYAARALIAAPGSLPGGTGAAWLATWIWVPLLVGLLVCLPLIFPDGTLLSQRWRWVLRLVIVQMIALGVGLAFAPGELEEVPIDNPLGIEAWAGVFPWITGAAFLLLLLCIVLAAVSVVLRFRRSRGLERLQVKCLAMGAVGVVVAFVLSAVLGFWLAVDVTTAVTVPIAVSIMVLATGLAVLRYRLYDIDRIIGRTLVYGILTVVLGAAYVGLVLAAQAAFSTFTGGSNLAIAVSTLVVAALFLPARSRVQRFVDRRFYRRRYDAQRTLHAFGSRLREQVELDGLSEDLLSAVAETMQPTSASLWLNDSRRVPKAVTIP